MQTLVNCLKRCWPKALFARLTLIWVIAIMAGHLINNAWLAYVEGHEERIQAAYYLKTDIRNAVQILEKLPANQRQTWLPHFQRQNYHFSLGSSSSPEVQTDARFRGLISGLEQELGSQYSLRILPTHQTPFDIAFGLKLQDGTPLTVQAKFYRSPQSMLGGIIVFVQINGKLMFVLLTKNRMRFNQA